MEPTLANYEEVYGLPTLEAEEHESSNQMSREEFRKSKRYDDTEASAGIYTE